MIRRITGFLLLLVLLAGLGGCDKESSARPNLNTDMPGRTNNFSFSGQSSETLYLSDASAEAVLSVVSMQQADYFLSYLYDLDEVKKRLDFDATVESHQFSALNEAGELEAAYLKELVEENNKAYLAQHNFGYTEVEDDYLLSLCDFIVQVVNEMERLYPEIDWDRVYCNLGNLKLLNKTGMLSYAEVSKEIVLSISENNTGILLNMEGEDGFSRVLIHEIMHILQIGCACEQIENCDRRAGIAVSWTDFDLNTADWTWMVEGAAERMMCTLTGGEAISYQYKMDYLCSMTMSVLLRDSVKADTMETLCFYSDTELLFDAFGCENQQQRDELLNMMITLQVLQIQPNSFCEAYKETTGLDLQNDEEAFNAFCYSVKPAICITLAKEYYENLVPFLQKNQVSYNDLFFLINLFEGHLNQHLSFHDESKAEINQPFFEKYLAMRGALFSALTTDNPDLNVAELYSAYEIDAAGENLLNAELKMLPEEKRLFMAERAQWQYELCALGQKVPVQ